jgi:cell division septation protein DedD
MMQGAQLRAVSRRVGAPEFLFISAGTPTGDIADVMRSGRWDIVLEALGKANVHLVLYAPADLPGLDVLLGRSPAVLLLSGDPEVAGEVIGALGLSEAVGLKPPVGEGITGDIAPPSGEFGTLWPAGSAGAPTAATDSTETAEIAGVKRALKVPHWKPATAVGLVVLAVWAGLRVFLGGANEPLEVFEEPAEPPVTVVAPPPETPQAYSLSLAAFEDASAAALRAETLTGRRGDVLFTTVPVLVSGRVFHRILAGPATDSAAAEDLRRSLGESLSEQNSSVWIVRATPLAFALGDYESREEAERRAEEIPVALLTPYVFEVGLTERPSFRVYAGAYADSAEASVAHSRLVEAGEEMPQLVRRVGRYVARP